MSPDPTLLLLGIVASAAAIGLSPYAALAAVGLAGHLGLLQVPDTLVGLSSPAVWGTLLAMTVLDVVFSNYRLTDLVWNSFHIIVRPLAAVLYASAATALVTDAGQWIAALFALLSALLIAVWVLAVRTGARTAGPISRMSGFTPLRLLAAAAIAILAISAPAFAVAIAAVLLIAPIPHAPSLWGAALLNLSSVLTVLTRPDRFPTWDTGSERLPRSLRMAVEAEIGAALGPSRSARVTLARFGPRWPYFRGRLVVAHEKPAVFVYRRGFRVRAIRLGLGVGHPDHAPLIETVEIEAPAPYALCLAPGAPRGPAIMAEMERTARPW